MRERLRLLYGQEAGDRTYEQLRQLLARFRGRIQQADRSEFDERDAILITYGDSLLLEGTAPLRALGTFASDRLRDLVSTIHVLPFFPYSSDYGFAVTDYLAVDSRLGAWPDIQALHRGFKLMFDFVLNHVSVASEWFQAFLRGEPPYDRFFITVDPATDLSRVTRPRATPLLTRFETARGERWVWTTFSADQADLDYANPDVLLRMVEVMLTYVERGADLLRMDAVAYLWKEVGTPCIHQPQTHAIVKLLREILDAVAPQVAIVTETNVPHRDNVSYFGDDDEAQMVYQFSLAPLVLDAFARGDSGHLSLWAEGVSRPGRAAGTFLNFLASHDGIGVVPAQGILSEAELSGLLDRVRAHGGEISWKSNPDGTQSPYELNCTFFDALSDPRESREPSALKRDRFLCAHAIMLALQGVPGLYLHSLFGSHNDQRAYERTGWKRDLNHARLALPEVQAWLADPNNGYEQVFSGIAGMLQARRQEPSFHPRSPQQVLDLGSQVFAVRRGPHAGRMVVAVHNLSAFAQVIPAGGLALAGLSDGAQDLLSPLQLTAGAALELRPYQAAWLQPPTPA
jgi:sucrose phosphorylase